MSVLRSYVFSPIAFDVCLAALQDGNHGMEVGASITYESNKGAAVKLIAAQEYIEK